ncbi:MAG: hypothetical protein IKV31_01985 [Paludibacteraceae bacterium]|nr:hypothetical protein [Paludibacteraceae bacterium]
MKRNYLYYLLTILLVAVSCEKDVMVYTTTIETYVTCITKTTVYCGGIISSNGNPTIKEVGVECCTTSDFESNVSRSCADNSQANLERFLFKIADLKGATQYYVRAYARNNYSTIYGQVLSFKTSDVEPTYLFSVSAYQFVTFSKGNLQYHPANNEWRFAENQTDCVGDANANISSTYNGWLDLFCWSTSSTNFGVSTSIDDDDFYGSFVDWGTNKIGNDAPNTWRTLTYDEWDYLLNNRPNASSLKGVAQVNGVNGLILLPDNWTCPSGVTFKPGFHSNDLNEDYYAVYQTFTADQWSQLEAAGAVFLPAAGCRRGSYVGSVQYEGFYWSATKDDSRYAYYLLVRSVGTYKGACTREHGQSVRLVKDLQ